LSNVLVAPTFAGVLPPHPIQTLTASPMDLGSIKGELLLDQWTRANPENRIKCLTTCGAMRQTKLPIWTWGFPRASRIYVKVGRGRDAWSRRSGSGTWTASCGNYEWNPF